MATSGSGQELWRQVLNARSDYLQQQFGLLPEKMQQLNDLREIWPRGGICQMTAPSLNGLGVCITFGLTNVEMPAAMRFADATSAGAGQGAAGLRPLEPRVPREVPAGLAGYGYELLILTPQADVWPLFTLAWFAQMEILNDIDLLGNVAGSNGVTVESVPLSDGGESGHFLVQPACSPILARVDLPSGLMHVLTATWITPDELEFAVTTEDGRWELLNRLLAGGVGPISSPGRASVLAR
jgi:hypothetical protein